MDDFAPTNTAVVDDFTPLQAEKVDDFTPTEIPEFRMAPKESVFDKMVSWFKQDPARDVAKAQNIYALSKVTNLPMEEVNKHYETLSHSSKITGISPDMTNDQYRIMTAVLVW